MTSRTVSIGAVGQCGTVPDLATIEAYTIGGGESAGDARAIVKDRSATLRESITDVSADQIRTFDLQIQNTDEMFEPEIDASFQATERIHIDCPPEHVESVVVDVTDAGCRIQTVQFQIHEDKRRELQDKAIESAMERARGKAEQVAAVEGFAVAEIHEAAVTDVTNEFESIIDEALGFGPETNLHPEPITVSEGVEVVYELSEE